MTFQPMDVPVYDIDWPMLEGKVVGLHDIKVVVYRRPSGAQVPCDVIVTSASAGSLTIALAARGTGTPYQGTYMTMTGLTGTGISSGFDNGFMRVDVTTDGRTLSKESGNLRIMPTCVFWLCPAREVFDPSKLPVPHEGWTREDDYVNRKITYRADETTTTPPTPNKLMMINGLSPTNLTIMSNGVADIVSGGGTITISPYTRDDEQQ